MTKLVPALTILAVAAFAGLVLYRESPERLPDSPQIKVEPPLDGVLSKLQNGDEPRKLEALAGLQLRNHTPAEFPRTVQAMIGALGDKSEAVRERVRSSFLIMLCIKAVEALKTHEPPPMIASAAPDIEKTFVALLDDPTAKLRVAAMEVLEELAADARLQSPPPRLVDAFEHDSDVCVRSAAAPAIVEYAGGPETLLPLLLKHSDAQHPATRESGAHAIERVRLLPSTVPLLIEGLALDDEVLCIMCCNSLEHIGREASAALPALLALIRKELDAKWPRAVNRSSSGTVLGAALKAFARICPPDGPLVDEAILLDCRAIRRGIEGIRDPNDGVTPAIDRPHFTIN